MDFKQCNIEIAKFKSLEGKLFKANSSGNIFKIINIICYQEKANIDQYVIMVRFTDDTDIAVTEILDFFLKNYSAVS